MESSHSESENDGIFVMFDWGSFDEDSYLDEIKIDYEIRPIPDLKRGTRLTLENLRVDWEEPDYELLHSRLSRLISPFSDISDFNIRLEIPNHPELSGEIGAPELTLSPKYHMEGELDTKGTFTGTIKCDAKVIKKFSKQKLGEAEDVPKCGGFRIEARAWDRDLEGLKPLMEVFKQSISEIRRTLDMYCGVSIYRDGFRVFPYGEKGNDWLNLDIRSRQNPVQHLANNQVIVAIRISQENNPELKDRSTREGMVHNVAHKQLEEWFKEVISLLEEARYGLRPRKEKEDFSNPMFEAFDLSSTVSHAKKELGKEHPIVEVVSKAEEQVRAGIERVQDTFSRLLMSAGLGHMIDVVIHEIGAPLGKINRQLEILEKELLFRLDDIHHNKVLPKVESIKGWTEQIYNLRQRLEPQTPSKRGRATAFSVQNEIDDNISLYEALLAKQKIVCKVNAPKKPLKVRMSRASLGQIVANLMDNSIFWITRQKGGGKGGEINISLTELDNGFLLSVSDDGPGVAEPDRSKIFEPYFSRKPNGTGLGLYIARLVIEPYGRLVYKDDCILPGACFEAQFERRTGL